MKLARRKRKMVRRAAYYRVPRYVGTEIPGDVVRRIDEEADRDARRRAGEVIVLLGEALDAREAAREVGGTAAAQPNGDARLD